LEGTFSASGFEEREINNKHGGGKEETEKNDADLECKKNSHGTLEVLDSCVGKHRKKRSESRSYLADLKLGDGKDAELRNEGRKKERRVCDVCISDCVDKKRKRAGGPGAISELKRARRKLLPLELKREEEQTRRWTVVIRNSDIERPKRRHVRPPTPTYRAQEA